MDKNITSIYIIAMALLITLAGCQKQVETEPQTLEEFNLALSNKKEELKQLESEIAKLTDKIAELDPSLQEKSKLVDTTLIRRKNFSRYIEIQGGIEAEDPVNAVSDIAGRITKLNFKEGDYVRRGQVIAQIDVESIQNQINEINSSLDLARDVFERQERLWNQNIGSEIQYLQARNNVDRLEKSLETVRHQLDKSKIYAPISGTVDMVMTNQGEVVSPGVPILVILNTSKLKVTTDLPERYLRIIKRGQLVELDFPGIDVQTKGRIALLGNKIDPANRTLELEINPLKTHPMFKPNLLAEIKIEEVSQDDIVMVPLEYILQEVDGTEFVYVATLDKKDTYRAQKRYVQTGEAADGNIVVTDGLEPGEAMIFKGSRNVSDNELIEFAN